ncbi:hypothetical protein BHE97_07215 [Aeromicrobium sp. PE09-221]|uniref:ABC transporter permease n=1 Tax=Aeromicrobium sp. PE09-221 TaxID=1898043 RepID=UPI000B3EA994|nr:FtsX-like permease family protein [Aeromicrobium sp. PE09-221]OUZ10540.1 hypothetical protein BHE97_07215 [Aeromicrobium sp. PE09-221]
MRTVTLASLRLYKRRYVAAFLAVAIGVAFIVAIGALNTSAKDGLTAGVGTPYRGADLVAADVYEPDHAAAIVDAVDADGGIASPIGYASEDAGTVGVAADDDTLRWQTLTDGTWPRAPGEIVVDRQAAKSNGAAIGDSVEISGTTFQVVGIVDSGEALMRADYYAPWDDVSRLGSFWTDSVLVKGSAEGTVLDAAPDARVVTADDYIAERQQEMLQGTDVLTYMLLIFVTIALTVAAIVIANTFSILFAQRTSDIAMLRCVGATHAQVRRSVRVESLAIGIVSAMAGIVGGLALSFGAISAVRAAFDSVPLGNPGIPLPWLLAGFAVGVLVTVIAAWFPTRATTRVSPLAALRPAEGTGSGGAAGPARIAGGIGLLLAGAALLILAVVSQSLVAMLGGGVLSFVSILVLGPAIVPPMIRAAGALARPFAGATARIATDNAIRNPKRTATTTSALLVGVTLTSAVVVGMASTSSAIAEENRVSYPVDAAVSAETELPADTVDRLLTVPDVEEVTTLAGTMGSIDGITTPVASTPRDTSILHDTERLPADGEILLGDDIAEQLEFPTTVTLDAGNRQLTLDARIGDYGQTPLVSTDTMRSITGTPVPVAAWIRTSAGADPSEVVGDLKAVATGLDLQLSQSIEQRGFIEQQMTIMTAVVVGLLGIAVLIALVGIGSTLGLSVLERRRENALLRALGVTRRQLRATLTIEAILLAVAAAVLGVAIGTLFGWIGVEVLIGQLTDAAGLNVPVGQLLAIVGLAGVAGVLASVLPSRRAAKTAPAAGLTVE